MITKRGSQYLNSIFEFTIRCELSELMPYEFSIERSDGLDMHPTQKFKLIDGTTQIHYIHNFLITFQCKIITLRRNDETLLEHSLEMSRKKKSLLCHGVIIWPIRINYFYNFFIKFKKLKKIILKIIDSDWPMTPWHKRLPHWECG